MNIQPQCTIIRPVSAQGVGIHTGQDCKVKLAPADENSGICFYTSTGSVQALPQYVGSTTRCTTLVNGDVSVSTVEHLMSALWGLGIDNLRIDVSGSELPILDGSSFSWCELLADAGIAEQQSARKQYMLQVPVKMQLGDSMAWAFPSDRYSINLTTYFAHPMVGLNTGQIECNQLNYQTEVASARTFGFIEEVEQLLAAGLARGGSLDNALVIYPDRYSSPLRYPDEILRHKLLDMLGDLYLAGHVLAHVIAVYPSHKLNAALARLIQENSITTG
ncbi:MAG: UDP-3-O-acyl-N-acetylglucosamine deacetylase [Armatimonadota bacterium]